MYLINPYVYILLALIMTSQYVYAVLVLCQCAPVSTQTGLLHNQSGDTHAVAEVTCANEVLETLDAVLSLLVLIKQYILLQSGQDAGRYRCFQLWTHRALIRFPLHFCNVCKRCTLCVVNTNY